MLRVLDQISGSEDGAHMLARCAGLRELLSDSTAFSQAMAELAHHISSNLPVGVEPVPDVKAPARVAAKVEAEELGKIGHFRTDVSSNLTTSQTHQRERCSYSEGARGS